jgi:diguanylate cyclase (GGDEF)-like protein/PAS domain S-box-containing protein
VVSATPDHNEAINAALRDSGHAARCCQVLTPADLAEAIPANDPELVVLFRDSLDAGLDESAGHCAAQPVPVPLLVVAAGSQPLAIAEAMARGASDCVQLSNIPHLQAAALREIRGARTARALSKVMNSAQQFKHELHSLKQVSVEAIADVQEGIIVNVNPAWLELFGCDNAEQIVGQPIMDLCSPADQAAVKGGIVACQRGKWNDAALSVNGIRPDRSEFPVEFCLENVEHDGEPAVRMLVKPDTSAPPSSETLIEEASRNDPGTGIFNREHFILTATTRLQEAPAGGVRALIYIRIDRFSRAAKAVGLLGTETIIAQFAQLIREYVQPSDIYGRFGGTMFLVLAERGTVADAIAWAQQFTHAVEQAVFAYEKISTMMTCSIGLVEADAQHAELPELLSAAEKACGAARQQGGNRVQLSEASGGARQVRQDDSIWVPRIRGALMENRFRLEHQPIAGLNNEIGDAYDILVRMLDDEGNKILPSEFMPAAERTGMTKSIDRWVIGASLSFCMTNPAELIFVRLSRDSILDETLPKWLQEQLQRTGLSPQRICFEVDEQVALEHLLQTQRLVKVLHHLGLRFALEHVGRTAESGQAFNRIPMDIAKIDGSLMQGLHKNAELQTRVKTLVAAAQAAGAATLAEQVQDANTMAVLWQLGISYIQGNYVQKREIVIEDTSQSTITTRALQMQA